MGIRESLLNTITSVGNGDFVRIVTSAGASSKATVANLFKSFESGLSAKSSLTTSDYIRVVGSDNVSYKQSMASVKNTLGIDALSSKIQRNGNNASSYTFTLPNKVSNAFYSFIVFGGVDGSHQFAYMGFISTTTGQTSATVTFQAILAGSRSFTGTFNDNTKVLTLTEANGSLVYGGVSIIAP